MKLVDLFNPLHSPLNSVSISNDDEYPDGIRNNECVKNICISTGTWSLAGRTLNNLAASSQEDSVLVPWSTE